MCDKGHGWLLDLHDPDDRSELESVAALLRGETRPLRLLGSLVGTEVLALILTASFTFPGSFESFQRLWDRGGMVESLAVTGVLVALAWLGKQLFGRRGRRQRALSRHLARTEHHSPPRALDAPAAVATLLPTPQPERSAHGPRHPRLPAAGHSENAG